MVHGFSSGISLEGVILWKFLKYLRIDRTGVELYQAVSAWVCLKLKKRRTKCGPS
jgi:hypothetical protein